MAVVLDDTNEVWPNCENLVIADRFMYFHNLPDFEKKYTGLNDHFLYFILELFLKVHSCFFDEGISDVKAILKKLRKDVLKGTRIVLSGVLCDGEDVNGNYYWQTAQRFGCECRREIEEGTTHVVAQNVGTKKTKIAVKKGIAVLHLLWLHLSMVYWTKLPEDYFTFENIGNFDILSIVALPLIRKPSAEYEEIKKKLKKHSEDEESSESESESDIEVSD
jgi:RNA polymerase II C-terminal domain phosphatase-like 3/4